VRRLLAMIRGSERGQVLPVVLVALLLGSVSIVPVLSHAGTALKSARMHEANMRGAYAADAGVEQVMWSLVEGVQFPSQIAGGVNGMSVNLTATTMGIHTVYLGELIPANEHYSYIGIAGDVVWDAGAQKYKYVSTVSWQDGSTTIHIAGIGARLPDGYTYATGSAAGVSGNLDTGEPVLQLDSYGHQLVSWNFDTPYPTVTENNPTRTQTFYIEGSGEPVGDYSFAVTNREDVGQIGEITGLMYRVTSSASDASGRVTAMVTADLILLADTVRIVNWQITN